MDMITITVVKLLDIVVGVLTHGTDANGLPQRQAHRDALDLVTAALKRLQMMRHHSDRTCCGECGGDNVEIEAWIDPASEINGWARVNGAAEGNSTCWCNDCEEHTDAV